MRLAWLALSISVFAAEPGYIDPVECRACHQKIYDAYQITGMGRSFQPVNQVPALAEFIHDASGRRYSIVPKGDETYLRRLLVSGPTAIEKRIDFVIGSGNHSKTFVHRDAQGKLIELPVSWYADSGGYWAMSPGYDRPDHSDLRREVSDTCLFCHNGYPSQANRGVANGIDCQRCHGPGEAHVQSKGTVLNPAKLTRDRQLDICLQCHMESASLTLPDAVRRFGRSVYSYRPGEPLADYKLFFQFVDQSRRDSRITVNNSGYGLQQSKCFQQSGTMTCTTCHDPHQVLRGEAAEQHFTTVCRSCHPAVHEEKTAGCTSCHMQKRRTQDAVHVIMTDHNIRRHPIEGDLKAPIEENHGRQTGPVKLLYPRAVPDTPLSRLYIAIARVKASPNLEKDIPLLQQAIDEARPSDAEPFIVLADACRKAGRVDDAIRMYRKAIERGASDAPVFISLGELLLARKRVEEAVDVLEPMARKLGLHAGLWNSLSVVYARQGRFEDALNAVSKALKLDPDDPVAWLNFGVCLHARADKKGAEAAYRQALLLQPDLVRARDYLKLVLEDKL